MAKTNEWDERDERDKSAAGRGIDYRGNPVIDPTKNVENLVRAESKTISKLRDADIKFNDAQHAHLREIGLLRAENAERLRVSDLDRLDKTRQVDVLAGTASAEALATAVQTLANTSDRNAETLRNLVNATAQTMAKQCVSSDTPILCSDLVWRPAGTLRVGDELIGFDEEPLAQPHKIVSRGRKYRRSVVTANALRQDNLLRVNTAIGSVRCNAEHPWLARRPARGGWTKGWEWIEAKDLKPGYEVLSAFDVWEVDHSWEAGWLAGIIDGEGCLVCTPDKKGNPRARLDITQVVGETAIRIGEALKNKIGIFNTHIRPAKLAGEKDGEGFNRGERKAKMQYDISTRAGVVRALGMIRPYRLFEMAAKTWEGCYIGGENRQRVIISVEAAGTGTIASLGTSTKTYIAGGFAMHNTSDQAQILSAQTDNLVKDINARILELQKSSYQGVGKSSVADPMMADFIGEMRTLVKAQAGRVGKSEGLNAGWVILIGAVTLVGVLVGIVGGLAGIAGVLYTVLK